MENETSSEEKLLKLIRKKNPAPGPGQGGVPRITGGTSKSEPGKGELDPFKFFNKIFLLVAAASVAYIAWTGVAHNQLMEIDADFSKMSSPGKIEPEGKAKEAKPLSYYDEILAQRDIFNTSFQKAAVNFNQQVGTPAAQPASPVANLRLVGLVFDERPQAIIFNQATGETLFLYPGEKIGEVVIEDILEEKVVVRYKEQRQDLQL